MADFPSSVKNFLSLQDGVDKVIAAHPNDRGGEITAIETLIGALGSTQVNTESFKNLLIDYIKSVKLEYLSIATLTLKAGEVSISDASGNLRLRRNTSDLTLTWANIDTGVEANATYYVYVAADAGGTGFVGVISLSSTTPTGFTFYRRIGSFVNAAGDVTITSITNDDESLNDVQKIKGWVQCNAATAIQGSYNVASVTDTGTGDYLINWATDFANDDYAVTASLVGAGRSDNIGLGVVAAATTQILTSNYEGTPTDEAFMAIGTGNQ